MNTPTPIVYRRPEDLMDCYFSSVQWALMKATGCRMVVRLNGALVSQLVKHGVKPAIPPPDEVFVGTAFLEDIDCVENVPFDQLP